MRVIAGSARRIQLNSLEGDATRPTLDRYKETLFNTMQTYIPGSYFIDVFAGTGAIGIEALSRGAARAVFIENNKKALAVINENLEKTHLKENAEVIGSDAISALMRLEKDGPADVIFIDPPYNRGLELQTLKLLGNSCLAGEDTLVVDNQNKGLSYKQTYFFHERGLKWHMHYIPDPSTRLPSVI